jgi:hypothetical protein
MADVRVRPVTATLDAEGWTLAVGDFGEPVWVLEDRNQCALAVVTPDLPDKRGRKRWCGVPWVGSRAVLGYPTRERAMRAVEALRAARDRVAKERGA